MRVIFYDTYVKCKERITNIKQYENPARPCSANGFPKAILSYIFV
jgi:hypothetical protein